MNHHYRILSVQSTRGCSFTLYHQIMPPCGVSHCVITYLLYSKITELIICLQMTAVHVDTALSYHSAVKTNTLLLTPHGYSPDFISGMLISQNDLCLCSRVLPQFKNHVVLMQPANVCAPTLRVGMGMDK